MGGVPSQKIAQTNATSAGATLGENNPRKTCAEKRKLRKAKESRSKILKSAWRKRIKSQARTKAKAETI